MLNAVSNVPEFFGYPKGATFRCIELLPFIHNIKPFPPGHEKICKLLNLIRSDLLVYGEKWTFSGAYGHRNKGISIERKHFAQIIN